MAIVRRLVAQDDNDDNQWLKVDHSSRYIVNDMDDWQFLFGPDSTLNNGILTTKIAAKFDENSFGAINLAAYLYDAKNSQAVNSSNCEFKIYRVTTPDWTETLLTTVSGSILPTFYYQANVDVADLLPVETQGESCLMIQVTINRLSVVYRDRIYVNHLGIYDNVTRLRADVEFLEITKLDQ